MSMEVVRALLLWSTIINYALLVVWFVLFKLPHEWAYRWCSRWFRMPLEQFNAINFGGIALYKVGILLFNLVPYIALRIPWH